MLAAVARTWILQCNPKLYDIDAALASLPVIYWRTPQYTDELQASDRALIWRAGKEAGFVAWGVLRTEPGRFDLARYPDHFGRAGFTKATFDYYAPVQVWAAPRIPKQEVAAVLPGHRIITAPMGTVFRLDSDELAALGGLLAASGYDLARIPNTPFTPEPLLPDAEPPKRAVPLPNTPTARARITPALFLLSSTPERPVEITIEGDSLRMLLVERTHSALSMRRGTRSASTC